MSGASDLREQPRPDAWRLYVSRGLRGFADGVVSVLLASYLTRLGFSAVQTGAIVTATLLGSAVLTLAVGLAGHRFRRRHVLLATAALMALTGVAFSSVTAFWPLLVVAFVGTLNPSAGDVTPFLPTEQAVLSDTVEPRRLTRAFASYNVVGAAAAALGALAAALPAIASRKYEVDILAAERAGFVAYAAVGVIVALLYARLSPAMDRHVARTRTALERSRRVVFQLAALFSLDSFGGGFVVQSLLALWLFRRFGLSIETAGAVFFGMSVLGGLSQFVAARLAERFGKIRTMVFTHLPANIFLMLAGVMPTAALAITFLLLRMSLSQMDVPARQAYVMAMVPPEERAAASSVTNVPRSLAAAVSPLIAGALLEYSNFGWPLLIAGALKAVYDLLLFRHFAKRRPPDEISAT